MKTLYSLGIATILCFAASTSLSCNDVKTQSSTTVYICTSPKAKVYHKYKNCKGLMRCSGDIKAVSLELAKKSRRACRICYK